VRTELPAEFSQAKEAAAQRPVNLLVFRFSAGPVYLSDRDLGASDGLSHDYLGLVREWGELSDLPLDEAGVAETRELTLTLWNGGSPPFSDRFLSQDPESVEVELWQWFQGTPESSAVLIDLFRVSDPVTYEEAGRELSLDLVSLSVAIECPVGELIEAEDHPDAPEDSIGRLIPLVFGTVPDLPCVCVDAPAETRLAASILPTDKTIPVEDASQFPPSGIIQIDDERLLYRSRTETSFNVTARGHEGTVACDHLSGRDVSEVSGHVFAACRGPVKEITNVRVDGLPPETAYTVQTGTDPATVTFDGAPRVSTLAESTRFLEMQFDAVASGNTALKPELAFDDSKVTSAAEISRDHRELRLRQVTVNANRGEIRKVWLGVEHWESEKLPHDYVEVEVSGLGVLGKLARPSDADATLVAADVDIDHGHSDSFIAEHTHVFTDRRESIREEPHTHPSTDPVQYTGVLSNDRIKGWAYSFDSFGNKIYWTGLDEGQHVTVTFPGIPTTGRRAWLEVTARKCPVFLGQYPRGTYRDGRNPDNHLGGGDRLLDTDCQRINDTVVGRYSLAAPVATLYLSAEKRYCWNATYGYAEIVSVKQFVAPEAVAAVRTGISLQVSDPGRNLALNPLTGRVSELATTNRPLTNVQVEQSSRTSVDYFDLTSQVAASWSWFTNREVRVRYVGSSDQRTVYLLHVWFEVEYSPRQIETGARVTCTVDGLIDDPAGSLTGTPGKRIRRPHEVRKYLLLRVAGLEAARIDADSFGAAGARYAELGYRFDLALTKQTSLKELERRLARQCRSRWYWDAGLAKIAFRELDAALSPVKLITPEMVLLGSMRAERGRVRELANRIRLFYRKDLLSPEGGAAGYLASLRASDAASVAAFGVRERPEAFLFDAVRDPAMAASLLAFYLEKEGKLRTTYTCDCFLEAFELEKEDALRLTHPFDGLAGHLATVRSATRILGSGLAGRGDLVRLSAELAPRGRLTRSLAEAVRHLDAFRWQKGLTLRLADLALPGEGLRAGSHAALAEQTAVAEGLFSLRDFDRLVSEAAAPDEDLRLSLAGGSSFIEAFFCEDALSVSLSGQGAAGIGDETHHAETLSVATLFQRTLTDSAHPAETLSPKLGGGFGRTSYGTSPYGR
jgi:hypothetical protein